MAIDKDSVNLFLKVIRYRWSSFGIYAIASIMSVSLRLKGLSLHKNFFEASIGMGILITLATALMLITAFRITESIRMHFPLLVIAILMIVGAVRGAFLHFEIELFGYENRITLIASVVSSTFYTAIYYSGASLFIELRNRRKNEFQAEFQRATLLRLQSEEITPNKDSKIDYEESMSRIQKALKLHLPVDPNLLPDTEHVKLVAGEIRRQIQLVVRPLSHRLYISSMGELKISSGQMVFVDALRDLRFPRIFILFYQFSVGLFGIAISIGLHDGLIKTFAAMLGTCLCFIILDLMKKFPRLVWQLKTFIFLLLLTLLPISFSEIFSSAIGIEVSWLAALIIAPTLPVIVLVVSLITLVAQDRKIAIAAAQTVAFNQVTSSNSSDISAFDLSSYVHNNLQSELLRISHQLDSSLLNNAKKKPLDLLGELDQALGRSISEIQEIQLSGFERVRSLPGAWEGFAQISIQIDVKGISQPLERALSSFLEEMITNSIRYGEASEISIQVTSDEQIGVRITHNGKGEIRNGHGLGSIWLQQLAIGEPAISNANGITKIEFTI